MGDRFDPRHYTGERSLSKITHPILEWSPKGIRILDITSRNIVEGSTVKEALRLAGNPKNVVLALGRRQTFLRAVRLPDVAVNEAKSILALQLEDIFPVDTNELSYDLEFTDDRNQDGRLATVFAAKAESVRQAKAELAVEGVKFSHVIPAFLGASAVAKNLDQDLCLVIDSSPEGMTLDVVKDGHVIYSRTAQQVLHGEALDAEIVRTLSAAQLSTAPVVTPLQITSNTVQVYEGHNTLQALADVHTSVNLLLPEEAAKLATKIGRAHV